MFRFKHFDVIQELNAQKVGTDSMILGAWTSKQQINPKNVLDIGTGTGVLALMMAQSFPESLVSAIEIGKENSREAALNFINSKFSDRLTIGCVSLNDFVPNVVFDLIIANPPYFRNSLKSGVQGRDVARHDLELSMSDLVDFVASNLSDDGIVSIVYPHEEEERLVGLFKAVGFYIIHCLRTINKDQFVRSFMMFSKSKNAVICEDLRVRLPSQNYSEEYIELTKEFHNKKLKQ